MLISDSTKSEVSNKVKDIRINNFQSEPHYQNQRVKQWTNRILDQTGASAGCWLLCLLYVCVLMNLAALDSLNGRTPMEVLTGVTQDISPLLHFSFYQLIYSSRQDHGMAESQERKGYWGGIAENIGDLLTLHRSDVRPCDAAYLTSVLNQRKGST